MSPSLLAGLAGGIQVPDKISPDLILKVLSTLGIKFPVTHLAEAVTLVQTKRQANPNLTVAQLLEDEEVSLLIQKASGASAVGKCPSCGFVQMVPLADPPPCKRCGTPRV